MSLSGFQVRYLQAYIVHASPVTWRARKSSEWGEDKEGQVSLHQIEVTFLSRQTLKSDVSIHAYFSTVSTSTALSADTRMQPT
jgi:hypothetical protein